MSWQRYARRFDSVQNSRRRFLKGVGSGAAALFLSPVLSRIRAQANGVEPRQRLVIVVQGNGFYGFRDWRRLTSDGPQIRTLDSLNSDLPQAPAFEPWRHRVAAFNGLANKQGPGTAAGHRSHWYALICRPYQSGTSPGGISIDEFLARQLGGSSVFDAVRLGAEGPGRGLDFVNSAAGPGSPLSAQNDPVEAWRELFGVVADDADMRAAFEEKGLLLDGLTSSIRRAESELSGQERWKFQRYLYSVETFQRRQRALTERRVQLKMCAPSPVAAGQTEDVGTLFEQQVHVAAGALICGLTEIVVLNVASKSPFERFSTWGFGGGHSLGHGGGATETRPGGVAGLIQIHAEISQRLAQGLLAPLAETPEGAGSMLDNTTLIYLNDNGEQHHAKYDNWPVIMVGDFGGRLTTGGRLIEYPNHQQAGSRSLSQLWNSVCYGMGVPTDDFAVGPRPNKRGPLDELFA